MDSSECWGSPDDPHPLLTIDEAADVLDIGRSLAYKLAREYIDSGGTAGMPVIRLGGCLRVPRWALLVLAATGRVVRLCDVAVPWMEQSGVR
jgi:hypothetical protein